MVPECAAIARSCSAASRAASALAGGQPRADERLERGRAIGETGVGQAAQRALGLVHGAGRIAAVERELGAHERGEEMPVGRLEQPARLLEQPLAAAQLGEAHHPVPMRLGWMSASGPRLARSSASAALQSPRQMRMSA